MAEDTLKGKAGLDTTEFKTGIATMNRELRVLESGFRASAASLGDWTSDATGLESRIKSLNSQLDIQRQKVALTRAEYERIKAEKGETSRAAQDLEIKLNKETETLGKMESELRETEGALEEVQQGTDETGQSVEDLGDSADEASGHLVSFQDVLDGTQAIAAGVVTAVAGLIATVGLLAAAIGGLVFSAADTAAQLVDLSAKTGISTTELQELSYVGDQVGTSLDTITGAQARLIRSMDTAIDQSGDYAKKVDDLIGKGKSFEEATAEAGEGLGDQAKAFATLGVATRDASGNMRDSHAVFNEVIDALGKVENPAERDALAMQIFGKSAQELNPLIKAGSAELARLADEAHDVGAVMDEDAVAGLEAFDDTMASVQAGLKGTLGSLAAEFLPAFQEIAKALQDTFKSDEFKRGVQQFLGLVQNVVAKTVDVLRSLLSGDLKGALVKIFGADNGAALFNFFQGVKNFIDGTLIPFVTTHAQEIKAALIGIGAALAAAGIVGIIAGIVAALNPVTLIIAAIVAAVGLLSAAWAGNWGGMRDIITLWWNNMLSVLQPLWAWLSTTIPAALQTLSGFWTNVLWPAIQLVWSNLNTYVFPLFQAIAEFLNAVFSVALRALAGIWQNVLLPPLRQVFGVLRENLLPVFKEISEFVQKNVQPIFEKFGGFVSDKLVPAFRAIGTAIGTVIDWLHQMASMLNNMQLPDWMTPGSPTPWEIGLVGINKAMRDLNAQLPVLAAQLQQSFPVATVPGLGGSAVDQSQHNDFQFLAPVIIQGEMKPGSLGTALKGRRY